MAGTLHGLLAHTVRRKLPIGNDAEAMWALIDPLEALTTLVRNTLDLDASDDAAPPASVSPEERLQIDPIHHLGHERGLRGVSLSLDEVFADGGFEQEGPRPFQRLVVEDLRNTFGVPQTIGDEPSPRGVELAVRDGSPATRRTRNQSRRKPDLTFQELLDDLRKSHAGAPITMEGTTESLPIQTVFESLSASRKTGTLHVRTNEETLVFELENGDVVFAASDATPSGDRLGDILVERGWLDAAQLRSALDTQADSQDRLGTALQRGEFVSRDHLRKALEEQIHRHFLRAFQTKRAAYAFAKGNRDDFGERVRLNISRLLFESARVSDETARDRALNDA